MPRKKKQEDLSKQSSAEEAKQEKAEADAESSE